MSKKTIGLLLGLLLPALAWGQSAQVELSKFSNSLGPNGSTISGAPATPPSGFISFSGMYLASDTVDSITNGNGYFNAWAVTDKALAGFTGGRQAIQGRLFLSGSPGGAGGCAAVGCVGTSGIVSTGSNLGGITGVYTNYVGAIFGMNGNAFTASGATFLKLVNGAEFDSTVASGSSTADHYGISVVEGTNHAVLGTYDDSAISVNNQDGVTAGWNYGLSFGSYAHHWAFTTTSTLIGAQIRQTGPGSPETDNALNGVDFRNVTFAVGGKAFASTGFSVDPSGNISTPTLTSTTAVILPQGSASTMALQYSGNVKTGIYFVNANTTDICGNGACASINGGGNLIASGQLVSGTSIVSAGTTFAVGSGTGACASVGTKTGGAVAGHVPCTGSTGASTITLSLPTVTNGYTCWGRDITTPTTVTQTGALSTTGATLTLTSVTTNDVIQFGCLGY